MVQITYKGDIATHDGAEWTSANPSLVLWLNSAFPPMSDPAAFVADLEAHGFRPIVPTTALPKAA